MRDHFCVYEKGATIRDIDFTSDENFRNGIYHLPVHAAVFDPEAEEVYVSCSEIFDQAIAKTEKVRRISVDRTKVAKLVKDKETDAIIFSPYINIPKIRLSELVRKLKISLGRVEPLGYTLLLLTCRTGESRRGVIHPPTVYEELEKLVRYYSGE